MPNRLLVTQLHDGVSKAALNRCYRCSKRSSMREAILTRGNKIQTQWDCYKKLQRHVFQNLMRLEAFRRLKCGAEK